MPSSIYVARVNRWIERLLNVKGGPAIIDIDPSVSVDIDFQSGVEDRYLQAWDRYYTGQSVAAVAAQFSRFMLKNPFGSNVIAVLEKIVVNASAASAVQLALSNSSVASFTNAGVFQNMDFRSGRLGSTVLPFFDTNVSQFNGSLVPFSIQVSAPNTSVDVIGSPNQEWVLVPGETIQIADSVVNTAMGVQVIWRERALEPSELTQ